MRPVATYSIVARDAVTGELGVAVQSHWFGVGTVVPWVERGVGAVATQSFAAPSYGSSGLALMRSGVAAPEALTALVDADDGRALRQVAMVDATGAIAAHTGDRCIAAAGHALDATLSVSCQGNLMASESVWGAMLDAYRSAFGDGSDLADRLLAALDAAESEGGDVRGRQSAALVVVGADPSVDIDVRVDDHPEPLAELRRLVVLRRAYRHMEAGDTAMEQGRLDDAMAEYGQARSLAPNVLEFTFWVAITLAGIGDVDAAAAELVPLLAREPQWRDVISNLVAVDLLAAEAAAAVFAAVGAG